MTAITDTAPVARPAGGLGKSVRDSLVVAKRNLIRMSRIPEMIIFGLIQPIMFVVLFSYVFGGSMKIGTSTSPEDYRNFLMAGIFAQTVTFATAGAGAGIADDMHKGLIDRFRSLPMARGAVLTGRTIADLVQTALTLLVLAVVALLVGWRVGSHADSNLGKALAAFGLLLLSGYAFTWVGALIGLSVRTPEAATSGGLIWLFPVTFLSNAFVDSSNMTPWLRHIADWNPFSATVQACRELFGNPGVSSSDAWPMQHPVWASAMYSVLIILIFRTLAVRKYRSATA
ncbi:ABC transporter permease [Streptomyces sp. NPDC059063]|uniref:ABC transporter permease n=1 Tax=unclassified Streptomyces TaxID=2593676 RepID=UPI003686D869